MTADDPGEKLIAELHLVAVEGGSRPIVLRSDNEPELACAAMAEWAHDHVGLHFIPPGEPWRNSSVESFNSRVGDECLNINSLWSLSQPRVVISDWKYDYNHHRRHSNLGYLPPGPLRCRLYSPMNASRPHWFSSRGGHRVGQRYLLDR